MNKNEYNGWFNYETWLVNLWMDNDQGSHEMWREIARDSIEEDEGCNWFYFEERLKEYLDMLTEDMDNGIVSGLAHDLIGAAISEVNTREISMSWIENELEHAKIN